MHPRINVSLSAILLLALVLGASACMGVPTQQGDSVPLPMATWTPTAVPSGKAVEVYFTDPLSAQAQTFTGGIDSFIVDSLLEAHQSVDLALYNFTLKRVANTLVSLHQAGVQVRLVMEDENIHDDIPQFLADNGIKVVSDHSQNLMHNKFIVIDGREVWTGSMNLSLGGTYLDNNNMVHIVDTRVAQNYTTEFEEMFLDDEFGYGSPADTPYPQVDIAGQRWEFYFAPEDDVSDHLLRLIRSARTSVHFLAYSFTLDDLGDALTQANQRGLDVRGVMEAEKTGDDGSEYWYLQKAGVDLRMDKSEGLLHHKVIIVDGKTVSFGSYNFTRSADVFNDENLVIAADPTIAALFEEEFDRIYTLAGD